MSDSTRFSGKTIDLITPAISVPQDGTLMDIVIKDFVGYAGFVYATCVTEIPKDELFNYHPVDIVDPYMVDYSFSSYLDEYHDNIDWNYDMAVEEEQQTAETLRDILSNQTDILFPKLQFVCQQIHDTVIPAVYNFLTTHPYTIGEVWPYEYCVYDLYARLTMSIEDRQAWDRYTTAVHNRYTRYPMRRNFNPTNFVT